MNDFSELEAELKQLRPAAPSPELHRRIERALSQPVTAIPTAGVLPRRSGPRWFFAGLGAAAAAAAALVLLLRVDVEETPEPPALALAQRPTEPAAGVQHADDGFVPDGFSRVVYDQRDEGIFFPEETAGTPVRRVRSQRQDTLAWHNPQTGASLRVSYPIEEVRLIPISGD